MKNKSIHKSTISEQQTLKYRRFVKIYDREDRCDIPKSAWRPLTDNAYLQTWKGVLLEKDPMQIAAYPMLLYELQPKTIIELGALKGGSAIWLADHLELFGIQGEVYCVDNDLSQLDEKAKTDSRIHFIEGDCQEISAVLPTELLSKLPHPWLVIEDIHDNLVGILEHFHHNGLQTGDYLIIEDTNKFMWEVWDDWEDQELIQRGLRKMDDLRSWSMKHQDEYLIDTYYQDMYGYNVSKNWNSILKRTSINEQKILLEQEDKKTGAKIFLASMEYIHIKHLIKLTQNPSTINVMDKSGFLGLEELKLDETKKFIQAISAYACPYSRESEILLLGIYLELKGLPIGYVILKGFNMDLLTAEVGMAILDKNYRNKGYGRLALNRMITYAFNELHFQTIGAMVLRSNKKIINILKKNGFVIKETLYKSWSMSNGELVDMLWMELKSKT